MYPAIVAWLKAGPLPWLAFLVPKPGILYAVVLLACGAVFVRRVQRKGLDADRALEALLAAAVGALVGTRLFYLVTRTRFWEMSPAQLIDGRQGTASWGAYLGAFLGLILYARWRKYHVLVLTDAATSAGPLACVIGRWNCLLAGDDFGRVTDWGGEFAIPPGHCPGMRIGGAVSSRPDAAWSLPVHPEPDRAEPDVPRRVRDRVRLLVPASASSPAARRRSSSCSTAHGSLLRRVPARPGRRRRRGLLSHSQYMCLAFILSGAVLWWWQRRASLTQPAPGPA